MKRTVYNLIIGFSLVLSAALYLVSGRDGIRFPQREILLDVRLPRLILGILVGAGLSCSGAVMQTIFKNPLADPYMLGISGGALFGSMAAKLFFGGDILLSVLFAFLFASLSFFLSSLLSKTIRGDKKFTLIMSGLMLNVMFSSLVIVASMFARRDFNEMFYLLMGSLNVILLKKYALLYIAAAASLLIAMAYITAKSKELDLLSFGDEIASASGIDSRKSAKSAMAASVLIVSILVSFSGIIGFVGIIVPNIVRMTKRSRHIILLPYSMLFGASAVVLSDLIAKNMLRFEMPIGVVTSIIGIPFLFVILKGRDNG